MAQRICSKGQQTKGRQDRVWEASFHPIHTHDARPEPEKPNAHIATEAAAPCKIRNKRQRHLLVVYYYSSQRMEGVREGEKIIHQLRIATQNPNSNHRWRLRGTQPHQPEKRANILNRIFIWPHSSMRVDGVESENKTPVMFPFFYCDHSLIRWEVIIGRLFTFPHPVLGPCGVCIQPRDRVGSRDILVCCLMAFHEIGWNCVFFFSLATSGKNWWYVNWVKNEHKKMRQKNLEFGFLMFVYSTWWTVSACARIWNPWEIASHGRIILQDRIMPVFILFTLTKISELDLIGFEIYWLFQIMF